MSKIISGSLKNLKGCHVDLDNDLMKLEKFKQFICPSPSGEGKVVR
jgi:hypothetical protein